MRWVDFRKDDGVVAIIVAILFSSLVFVGFLAIVIDGGALYRERRVLQNAADSATLANTRECALQTSNCSSQSFASAYTNANSPDSLSNVKELCGKTSGTTGLNLNTCAPISAKPFAC
ncbi:MAG: pilus assembly protein TadG-related protein [Candidatus Nanopelagicaceae bacterium]